MATRNPTLTPEALKEIIDQAVKGSSCRRRDTGKLQDETGSKIVSAFIKAGFKNHIPFDPSKPLSAQTVLTFGKWALDMGRKVKTGQKALRFKGYHVPLFHFDQREVMSPAERKEYFARQQAKAAKREEKEAAQAQASA